MSREEEFTHEGFVYANNIYMERKCELFEVKDITHDFVQGAIYADQHPRKGLVDIEKACEWLSDYIKYFNFWEDGTQRDVEEFRKAMEE